MSESKHLFTYEPTDQQSANIPEKRYVASEASWLVRPHRGRPQLTPDDIKYNQGVRTLFNNIIPGLPIDADPLEIHRDAEPIENMVAAVMKKLNLSLHEWIDDLRQAWPEILPPEIASKTRPAKFENNILFVDTVSSIALFEIRRTRLKEIEAAVRKFAPDKSIRHIQLTVNYYDH